MKTFVFYYLHCEDLGHLFRLSNILRAVHRSAGVKRRCVVFQAGRPQALSPLAPFAETLTLPRPYFGREHVEDLPRLDEDAVVARVRFMTRHVARLRPDVFVTDFFPFARLFVRFEVVPVLRFLKKRGVRICASLPLAYFVHPSDGLRQLAADVSWYDRILIHTPAAMGAAFCARQMEDESRISRRDFLKVFAALRRKIVYTGFVMPAPAGKKAAPAGKGRPAKKKPAVRVLVYRGGGTTSSDVIETALEASRLLGPSYRFLVVAGPATPEGEMRRFEAAALRLGPRQAAVERFLPDFVERCRQSDVCVGSAGQTALELLYLKKPAVLVPFCGTSPQKRRFDQLVRARFLEERAGASVVRSVDLSPRRLAEEIDRQARRKAAAGVKAPAAWFRGAEASARFLAGIS